MPYHLLFLILAVLLVALIIFLPDRALTPSNGKTAPIPENDLKWLNQ